MSVGPRIGRAMAAQATMIDFARPARKNLVLLAAIVVMQVAQPLLGHRSVEAGAFFDIVFAAICLYVSVVVFLGFAVAVILGDIFRKRVISADDVIGALCGYLLGALVWANLYTLTY